MKANHNYIENRSTWSPAKVLQPATLLQTGSRIVPGDIGASGTAANAWKISSPVIS